MNKKKLHAVYFGRCLHHINDYLMSDVSIAIMYLGFVSSMHLHEKRGPRL